ncbi:MAG: hypothetical protein ABI467_10170 [Kofleriaceae bacterium]
MRFILVSCCLLGACTAPPVDDWVSIDRGIYGALRTYCDTAFCGGDDVLDHAKVLVEDGAMAQTLATTTSDGDGYYEVALEPGDYAICMDGTSCGSFSVAVDTLVRLDFEAGPGGGRWIPVGTAPRIAE